MIVDSLGGEAFKGKSRRRARWSTTRRGPPASRLSCPAPTDRLRHGMFGRMNLVVERRDGVLVVPTEAISWEGDKQFVYRVADGKVNRQQVTVGLRNDTHVEIASGLAEGDVVAVGDLLELKEGEAVTVKGND